MSKDPAMAERAVRRVIGHEEWLAEGKRRFGEKARHWRFVCPSCGTVQTPQDLLDAGLSKEEAHRVMAYSCVGRFTRAKGCDWTLGGLLQIHTLEVQFEDGTKRPTFEFAEGGV